MTYDEICSEICKGTEGLPKSQAQVRIENNLMALAEKYLVITTEVRVLCVRKRDMPLYRKTKILSKEKRERIMQAISEAATPHEIPVNITLAKPEA